jgi:hypothetical protein
MLDYSKLSKKPRSFQSFTGVTVQQFDFLSQKIESEYRGTEEKRLSRRKREREIGAGHPFKISVKDRVLMLFMYYRMYTSYGLLGFLFDLDAANVYRDIRYLEPAVRRCIPIPQKKYADAKKATTLEELEQYFPELKAIIDASEQQIPRPKDKKKRRTHYSGKKKRHTVKNQYAVNLRGEIVHKPPHSPGRPHDYSVFKKKHPTLPELQTLADLGYKGMENDYPEMNAVLPCKKKRGVELAAEQKQFNHNHSRIRVIVEHTIANIKKFRIMRDIFRNRLCRYDRISDIICGLVNFRIEWKNQILIP